MGALGGSMLQIAVLASQDNCYYKCEHDCIVANICTGNMCNAAAHLLTDIHNVHRLCACWSKEVMIIDNVQWFVMRNDA